MIPRSTFSETRVRSAALTLRYPYPPLEAANAPVDWLQCVRQSDEGRMTWDWRPTVSVPKHPRHYDEAFKRQIVQ